MARAAACLLLACLCGAGFVAAAGRSPITAWSAAPWLNGGSSDKAVPAAQALEALVAAATGAKGRGSQQALAGLLDDTALAAAAEGPRSPVDAIVVLSGSADGQHEAAVLAGAAGSLTLAGAEHEGAGHPVFEALHAAAPGLPVKVLGDCGGALVPAAAPATAEALRQQLAEARSGAGADAAPAVLVLCPAPEGGAEAEAALLQAAASALAEAAPGRWLLVRAAAPADAAEVRRQRRRLAAVAAAALSKRGDAANCTSNYTVCDPVCQKHVMWFEGIIIAIVLLIALTVGCCCMHLVDVPTRFAQPESRREHAD